MNRHTVLHIRLYFIYLCIHRQPELADKLADAPLTPEPLICLLFLLPDSLSANSEDSTIFNLDLHFLFLQSRKISLDYVNFRSFLPVYTNVGQGGALPVSVGAGDVGTGAGGEDAFEGSQMSRENGLKMLLRRPPKKLGINAMDGFLLLFDVERVIKTRR
ncbi:unnamed protein product [Ilex paraguariensis]|uniref:Uncharacterized protein n=1 Tax=Ilex paraguariensis TaxID=185542 RepID=A0ABC8QT76_9AQUA